MEIREEINKIQPKKDNTEVKEKKKRQHKRSMKPKASSLKIYTILTKLLPDSSRKKNEREPK